MLENADENQNDLTRQLRPALNNPLKKGEGVGGGAKPTLEKEKSLGLGASRIGAHQQLDPSKSYVHQAADNVVVDTFNKLEEFKG